MTHFERIKAMSLDEIVEFFEALHNCDGMCDLSGCICYDRNCPFIYAKEFLESEVEVRHAYWETVTELKDNTVCGSDVNISYQRCSNCKYPMGVTDNIYCGHCGAKMDGERKKECG